MEKQWWVYATARHSGHRSIYGPFPNILSAAFWARTNRPDEDWKKVSVQGRDIRQKRGK